jgi:hypothetical protein
MRPIEATEDALARTWKDFLPESEGLGGAATLASAGHLLVGGGARKEEGLVSPDNGIECGAYVVPPLLVPCKAHPCNSFSASRRPPIVPIQNCFFGLQKATNCSNSTCLNYLQVNLGHDAVRQRLGGVEVNCTLVVDVVRRDAIPDQTQVHLRDMGLHEGHRKLH